MEKITSLSSEEFSKFSVDKKTGNVLVPEGYELRKVETKEEKINKAILGLEQQMSEINPPTNEELIEEGKMLNYYYRLSDELLYLQEEKNKLK